MNDALSRLSNAVDVVIADGEDERNDHSFLANPFLE